MRPTFTAVSLAITILVQAQCTVTTLGIDPNTQPANVYAIDIAQGEMVSVIRPYRKYLVSWFERHTTRSITVIRSQFDGTPIWSDRIEPINPEMQLLPRGIVRTLDGGVFTYGDLKHGPYPFDNWTYRNQFAVKHDVNGIVEFARIYMAPNDANGVWPGDAANATYLHSAVELDTGGFNWLIYSNHGVFQTKLDPGGIPVWSKHYYEPADLCFGHGRPFSDGSMAMIQGDCQYQSGKVYVVNADGIVAWGTELLRHMEPTHPQWDGRNEYNSHRVGLHSYISRTNNGDILFHENNVLTTIPSLTRFDASGTVLWSKELQGFGGFIEELPNGELLSLMGAGYARLQADGQGTLSRWERQGGMLISDVQGDSLAVVLVSPSSSPAISVAMVDHWTDLTPSCEIDPSNNIGTIPIAIPTAPITIQCDTAVIKHWDMYLGSAQGQDLDLAAFGSMGAARPGFSTQISGSVLNFSATIGGPPMVTCTIPSVITINNVTPTPDQINGNVVSWVLQDPLPVDGIFSFAMNGTVAPDPNLIGTTLTGTVEVTQDSTELDLTNNMHTFSRIVVGAYDPNDKLASTSSGLSETEYYPGTDEWIDYTIRFQNTGTAPAVDVVIVDTLPAEVSVGTFVPLGASHPYTYELGGDGILTFTFNNIQLPDSNTNEPESHGMVSFRLGLDDGLPLGTTITNNADIFFDFNPPIRTPDNVITLTTPTSIVEQSTDQLVVYPIPVKDILRIDPGKTPGAQRIMVLTIDGRVVLQQDVQVQDGALAVTVANLEAAVYVVVIRFSDGSERAAQFVKQ